MKKVKNPFVLGTYVSPEYFCDREQETSMLRKHIDNGRNVALSAPRRLGKTGLIHHFLQNEDTQKEYHTFFIDLYATNSLAEMVQALAVEVYNSLRSTKERWWERFATVISSLSMGLTVDPMSGQPTFSIGLGDLHSPEVSLDQLFQYLETAERPCIVAIDEFQQIAQYEEKNIEALLRTKIQRCSNTHFIFSGSKRHMMMQMFNSPSRPFYQSCINMSLDPLPLSVYTEFCQQLFAKNNKQLEAEVVSHIYTEYEGYTWYMHMILNELYSDTEPGNTCTMDMYEDAQRNVVTSQAQTYKELLSILPPKQKMVLEAIAKEGKVNAITSAAFIRKHSLPSTSSVQAALKGLLEKEIAAQQDGTYSLSDYFLAQYIRQQNRCS